MIYLPTWMVVWYVHNLHLNLPILVAYIIRKKRVNFTIRFGLNWHSDWKVLVKFGGF